jgi:hypothetical protein
MNDPIKVIFKYKNELRKVNYHIYIFVGDLDKKVIKILEKITDLNLYDSLISLDSKDIKYLENKYGILWFKLFFNTYHINNIVENIKENSALKKEIQDKFGVDWYRNNIDTYKISEKKINYNFESLIKNSMMTKKLRTITASDKYEENIDIDYTTNKKNVNSSNLSESSLESNQKKYLDSEIIESSDLSESYDEQFGGEDEVGEILDEIPVDELSELEYEGIAGELITDGDENELAEIERIYQSLDVDEDKNVKETQKLIEKALEDNKIFDKRKKALDFDQSKDNNVYDENLKDVFKKYYIYDFYIYKDDTIKVIKDKITCSIKNNSSFGKDAYIIPSRQYLWSEYFFNNNIEKVMLGQKWIAKNELLTIDIEPNNNLRFYEELRKNLKDLRDNIRRYSNKIKRVDDENNILFNYDTYMNNNEIFFIDIYNELGKYYKKSQIELENLIDVYLKIYFPKIGTEGFKNIIELLNDNPKTEMDRVNNIYENIKNDIIMEIEIMDMVESVKLNDKYIKFVGTNYITQASIYVQLRTVKLSKIDLFKIFDNYELDNTTIFIQYQTTDGQLIFKFKEDELTKHLENKKDSHIISKWFENVPYGISFKITYEQYGITRFMAINLSEIGRIDYKTSWKEENKATLVDLQNTYNHVRNVIEKINFYAGTIFEYPNIEDYNYAFINTIQKFTLPEKSIINHNDLSEISRFFYPYVSLVIEPRKRVSKESLKTVDVGKFGTYLRYKRISKYENNNSIELRIIYFMRNYEYTNKSLSQEISKQFNITEDRVLELIEDMKKRYPFLKKSRNVLKNMGNLTKYKPPGIGIDIQGKQKENYKIRISGTRDIEQLNRIIEFIDILMFLYVETYIYKKKEMQIIYEKLKKLNNIAKRRHKVDEIVKQTEDIIKVKEMEKQDASRLAFKPDKGQNQWTRICQNSGKENRRRPQQYTTENIDELINDGYKFNKDTGLYEKKIKITNNKGIKKDIIVKTLKLQDYDSLGNPTDDFIYYTCSPEENGEHIYVGFLTKSKNPHGQCMPCCFKIDPMKTANKEKLSFIDKCSNKEIVDDSLIQKTQFGDKIYILQDTNKIQDGRFGYLPKYLNYYFNIALDNDKSIKQYYLDESKSGYFFKYGINQSSLQFIRAIAATLNLTIEQIKNSIIKNLMLDEKDIIYTSLNAGDIKTLFKEKQNYIDYISYSNYLDYDLISDIISIPGILDDKGLNIIIFDKKEYIIKKIFEKEKIKEDFYLICQVIVDIASLDRKNIFLIKDEHYYYPIFMIIKKEDNINIIKTFKYKNNEKNIVYHIKQYYDNICSKQYISNLISTNNQLTAIETINELKKINNPAYTPSHQIIDMRNKCTYLILSNKYILPTKPSQAIYNLKITSNLLKFINSFDYTIKYLEDIYTISKFNIKVKPIGVYYNKKEGDNLIINAIMTNTKSIIPVTEINMLLSKIKSYGYIYEENSLNNEIDKILQKNDPIVIDKRISLINHDTFYKESYELFRFEFNYFINKNEDLKKKLINLINHNIENIKLFLYKIIDQELYDMYNKLIFNNENTDFSKIKKIKFIQIIDNLPNLDNYRLNNVRSLCKDKSSIHCALDKNKNSYLALTALMTVEFINKISEELINNDYKAFELLGINNYFVSEIIDRNIFKEIPGQIIITSTNTTIKKTLEKLFQIENIPIIGKRHLKLSEIDYDKINTDNPLKEVTKYYMQNIIENNITILRAYTNCYYWINKKFIDIIDRNLGYYNNTQTDMALYFRGMIIDWLQNKENRTELLNFINSLGSVNTLNIEKFIIDYIIKMESLDYATNGILESFILNTLHDIPIVIFDDNDLPILYFNKKKLYLKKEINENVIGNPNYINLKFSFYTLKNIPDKVYAIYYKVK